MFIPFGNSKAELEQTAFPHSDNSSCFPKFLGGCCPYKPPAAAQPQAGLRAHLTATHPAISCRSSTAVREGYKCLGSCSSALINAVTLHSPFSGQQFLVLFSPNAFPPCSSTCFSSGRKGQSPVSSFHLLSRHWHTGKQRQDPLSLNLNRTDWMWLTFAPSSRTWNFLMHVLICPGIIYGLLSTFIPKANFRTQSWQISWNCDAEWFYRYSKWCSERNENIFKRCPIYPGMKVNSKYWVLIAWEAVRAVCLYVCIVYPSPKGIPCMFL